MKMLTVRKLVICMAVPQVHHLHLTMVLTAVPLPGNGGSLAEPALQLRSDHPTRNRAVRPPVWRWLDQHFRTTTNLAVLGAPDS